MKLLAAIIPAIMAVNIVEQEQAHNLQGHYIDLVQLGGQVIDEHPVENPFAGYQAEQVVDLYNAQQAFESAESPIEPEEVEHPFHHEIAGE